LSSDFVGDNNGNNIAAFEECDSVRRYNGSDILLASAVVRRAGWQIMYLLPAVTGVCYIHLWRLAMC